MGKFVGKPPAKGVTAASLGDWRDDAFAKRWPALAEYLSLTTHDDGSARVPSSLSLFCEDGRLKAALSDRDVGRVVFQASDTFTGLLDGLEAALASGSADWRASRTPSGRGVRK